MPPLPRLKTEPIRELAAQLRFAPRDALLRDLERAELLVRQIRSDLTYPEDFVIYRITGYRPELSEPAVIPGEFLLADLPSLVEHLCAAANLRADEQPDAVPADDLASKWSVSRKTLARYRKHGLVARRVKGEDERPRLVFLPDTINAFEQTQAERIDKAGAFTRVEPDTEDRIIRRARIYRTRFDCTLNQAAARLAKRFDRSHEAVRQMLRRYDERAEPGDAIFLNTGPLSPRARELAYRAWRRAVEPGAISKRVGKPAPAVLRVINEKRAEALRGMLPSITRTLDADQAPRGDECTRHGLAQTGLGIGVPQTLGDLLEYAAGIQPPEADAEIARGLAFVSLRARAAEAIAQLPKHGSRATDLDRIETDLRWASRIQTEMVRSQLGVARRALENRVSRPLTSLGTRELHLLLQELIAGIAEGVERYDPDSRGRLASPVGLAVDRRLQAAIAKLNASDNGPGKARPMFNPDVTLGDWSAVLAGWQTLTEPDPRVRLGSSHLGDRARMHLRLRFGWAGSVSGGTEAGGPPKTLAELAEDRGREVIHLARSERSAIRRAIGLVRSSDAQPND